MSSKRWLVVVSALAALLGASMNHSNVAQAAAAQGQAVNARLHPNTATEAEIMLIPGMTARMAEEFEEYRPYTSMDQFNREIGKYVNQAEVARLASYVSLN